ncbi:hypothetical protein Mycch_6072 (plasmid) [Mycolicibacterium chubuense NBB4]|uniref:Cupin domain protein n=1 Tax=Mycolicibacterium chubuense (strain NBB4) TaxID=710421 RepID=I4BTR5_MYCCN|nr:hypothetical protein [Mycolicibacterium chubuense]AFM20672.1 hypothetical protein Mycch_6072 [Mycolicibacterium chubuense NBB4]
MNAPSGEHDEDRLPIAEWLRILVSGRPHQVIGDDQRNPYLLRWFLIPRNPVINIYRHRFCRSDPSVPHDHPWHFASIVLSGHYREIGQHHTIVRGPGSVAFRRASAQHRVELIGHPVTTIIITGPRCRGWGFWCPRPDAHPRFVPWQQFGSGGCGEYLPYPASAARADLHD